MSSTYKIDNVVVDTVTNALTASLVETASYLKGKINVNEIAGINNDNIEVKNILNGTASYALSVQSVYSNQFNSNITYDITSSYSLTSKNAITASSLKYPNNSTSSLAITASYALNALTASYANQLVSTGGMPLLVAAVSFKGAKDFPNYNTWLTPYRNKNAEQRITASFNVSNVKRTTTDYTPTFIITFATPLSDPNYYVMVGGIRLSSQLPAAGSQNASPLNLGGEYGVYTISAKSTTGFSITTITPTPRSSGGNSGWTGTFYPAGASEPYNVDVLVFKS